MVSLRFAFGSWRMKQRAIGSVSNEFGGYWFKGKGEISACHLTQRLWRIARK
jgi:hypothetical protein